MNEIASLMTISNGSEDLKGRWHYDQARFCVGNNSKLYRRTGILGDVVRGKGLRGWSSCRESGPLNVHAVVQADRVFCTTHVGVGTQAKGVVVASKNWQGKGKNASPARPVLERVISVGGGDTGWDCVSAYQPLARSTSGMGRRTSSANKDSSRLRSIQIVPIPKQS